MNGEFALGPFRAGSGRPGVMAVVNRTEDSFYSGARGATADLAKRAITRAHDEGARLIDIGGVRAGHGRPVGAEEEMERVLPTVEWLAGAYPDVAISVDTWRAAVAREAATAGAHLINDTWAGADPELRGVAAERGLGLVCSHTGGQRPRTDPHRVSYGARPGDVVAAVEESLARAIGAAREAGIPPHRLLADPTHDFGKNTRHGLRLLRDMPDLVARLNAPVLLAISRKDFLSETLGGRTPEERLAGTLAATALAAKAGVALFRTHDVRATLDALAIVGAIEGWSEPARSIRGLA